MNLKSIWTICIVISVRYLFQCACLLCQTDLLKLIKYILYKILSMFFTVQRLHLDISTA
jgi:hypothetical protein